MTWWQVTGQQGGVFLRDADGRPVPAHVVSFETAAGQLGQVWVPDTHYDADTVRAAIAVRAAAADDVAALPGVTGQVPGIFRRGPDGTAYDGVLVDFTTPGGLDGQVWVGYAQYDPAIVRAAIEAESETMRQVGQLAAAQEGLPR